MPDFFLYKINEINGGEILAHTQKPRMVIRGFLRQNFEPGELSQFLNEKSQAGFVAVGVLVMNQTGGGGFVDQGDDFAIFFGRFFFAGFFPQIFYRAAKDRAVTPVAQTFLIGSFHSFGAGLMIWQFISFLNNKTISPIR